MAQKMSPSAKQQTVNKTSFPEKRLKAMSILSTDKYKHTL